MDEQIEFSVAEHSVFHRGQAVRDGKKSRKVASAVWGLNGMVSIVKRQVLHDAGDDGRPIRREVQGDGTLD
jgi:hypothetical protein